MHMLQLSEFEGTVSFFSRSMGLIFHPLPSDLSTSGAVHLTGTRNLYDGECRESSLLDISKLDNFTVSVCPVTTQFLAATSLLINKIITAILLKKSKICNQQIVKWEKSQENVKTFYLYLVESPRQ